MSEGRWPITSGVLRIDIGAVNVPTMVAIGSDSESELDHIQESTGSELEEAEDDTDEDRGGTFSGNPQLARNSEHLVFLALDTIVECLRTQEPAGSRSCDLLRISSLCSLFHRDHNEPEYYCPCRMYGREIDRILSRVPRQIYLAFKHRPHDIIEHACRNLGAPERQLRSLTL